MLINLRAARQKRRQSGLGGYQPVDLAAVSEGEKLSVGESISRKASLLREVGTVGEGGR